MATKIKHPVFGTKPVPIGRTAEWYPILRARPDADCIAIRAHSAQFGAEYTAEVYASRAQLLMLTRAAARASNRGNFLPLIPDRGEVSARDTRGAFRA